MFEGKVANLSFEKWRNIGNEIMNLLRVETYPVAVKLVKENENFPDVVRRPLETLKFKINLCQAFTATRRYGWTIGVSKKECACPLACFLFGWASLKDKKDLTDFFFKSGFFRSVKAAEEGAEFTIKNCTLKPSMYKGIITSPLNRTKIIPDIVLIYGNPTQAFLLIHGYLSGVGGALEIQYTGRHASCGHGVIQTFLSQKPNLVLPDEGDKIFAATTDEEVIFASPAKDIESILEGIKHLFGKKIMKYPTPFNVRFTPAFPKPFEEFLKKLEGSSS